MLEISNDDKIGRIIHTERLDDAAIDIPALIEARDYWNRVRRAKFAPSRMEFRLHELDPQIIPCVVVIDFLGPPLDFYYRFFGSRMVEVSGMELTGKSYYADKIRGYGFVNAEVFPQVIAERRPICTRTSWISISSREKTTTTIRLPLSKDGENVTGGVTVNHFGAADGAKI